MFSIQLDESTDISNVSQLVVFVRWAMGFQYQYKGSHSFSRKCTARTADILHKVDEYFKKWELKWENLCSVCTDGASAMIGARSGFARRVKELSPGATLVHCMIHRQALARRTLPSDLQSALKIAIKTLNCEKECANHKAVFNAL